MCKFHVRHVQQLEVNRVGSEYGTHEFISIYSQEEFLFSSDSQSDKVEPHIAELNTIAIHNPLLACLSHLLQDERKILILNEKSGLSDTGNAV